MTHADSSYEASPAAQVSAMVEASGPGCSRDDLIATLDAWLEPARFRDYGPNGLQVQGRAQVETLVSGVTASRALIEAAAAHGADAILVHHGLFWRGQDGRVVGWMRERLRILLGRDINLMAYHLPLDAHASLGNNAQLGQRLGFHPVGQGWGRFGEHDLGFLGACDHASAQTLARHVRSVLGHEVTLVGPVGRPVRRVAWCSGGAQGYFEAAVAAGVDAFLTGEISEPQAHIARESGVAFLACGHHATERYGAAALGEAVARHLGLRHVFMDIDNPA